MASNQKPYALCPVHNYIDSHYVFEMKYLAQCYDCEFQFKFQ